MAFNLQQMIAKKSIFLVIVVLLLFFIGGIVLWGGVSSKMVSYQNQIQQKKQKYSVIEDYVQNKKRFDDYIGTLRKVLTSDALINQISDYASQNHVEVDFNPQGTKKYDLYTSTAIHLTVRVKDFKDLVSFVQMLETSPYGFRVENLAGKMDDSETAGFITFDLNLTSAQIKK